jgi:drug/metabolite transporter (DMT)-like permease
MRLAFLVLINLIYAGIPTMMKLSLLELPAVSVVWLRHTIAFLILLPLWWFSRHCPFSAREWLRIAIASALAFTMTCLLQVTALQFSSAAAGALMVAIQPIITIALAALFLHEKVSLSLVVALGVALIGFAVLSGQGITQLQGSILYLAAILCESSLGIFLRPLLKLHSPLDITIACLACATVYLLPLQGPLWDTGFAISAKAWTGVIYMGLGCSAIGTLLWLVSLQKMTVSTCAIAWFLQPVWGSVLPILVLGEEPTLETLLGGGLIVLAMTILFGPRRRHLPNRLKILHYSS